MNNTLRRVWHFSNNTSLLYPWPVVGPISDALLRKSNRVCVVFDVVVVASPKGNGTVCIPYALDPINLRLAMHCGQHWRRDATGVMGGTPTSQLGLGRPALEIGHPTSHNNNTRNQSICMRKRANLLSLQRINARAPAL